MRTELRVLTQIRGSDSFLLQKDGRYRQRNEPRAQQLNPGPAIHLALDRLQPIDLTFYRSVAPFFGDRCFHRENVPPQLVREVANQLDPTGTSSVQPTVQRGNRSGLPLLLGWFEFGLLENRPEAHHQPSHGGIAWTALFQSINDLRLAGREFGPRLRQ